MSQSFEDVKNWLFNSDLVINDENNKNCGAVHSYFDESQNKFGFLYPEITGYFLSTLRFLNSIEKNDIYIDYGKKSANWLLSLYDKYGGIIIHLIRQFVLKVYLIIIYFQMMKNF